MKSAAAATMLMLLSGCRRLPEGFPSEFLDIMKKIADDAVAQCDALIASGDCYDSSADGPPRPGQPYLHLPDDPFHGSPLNDGFSAVCTKTVPTVLCVSPRPYEIVMDKAPCIEARWVPGWELKQGKRDQITMAVDKDPSCPKGVGVSVIRISPGGALMSLGGFFWLSASDAHPRKRHKLW